MSRLAAGVAGVLLLSLFLLIEAPARLLPGLLPSQQVLLQGLSGTIWSGTASRAMVATEAGYLQLGRVTWSLRPWSLLLLAPSLDIDSQWGAQFARGEVSLRGPGSFGLRDFDISVPADLLRQFAPVALSGTLSAQVGELQVGDGLPRRAAGRLVWQDAVWQAPQGPLRLGAYALDFSQAKGEPLTGQVITLAGPVRAEGRISLAGRNYTADIGIAPEGTPDPQLAQALSLLAQPEEGVWRVRLEGDI